MPRSPTMMTVLEGLVTTLLSLDHRREAKTTTATIPTPTATPALFRPRRRSHSLSSTSSSSCSSSTSSSSSDNNNNTDSENASAMSMSSPVAAMQKKTRRAAAAAAAVAVYHPPPPHQQVNYDHNDTVFGRILRGELPALVLAEGSNWLCFQDIQPRAPLHALVIPKAFIGSVFDLTPADVPLLEEMQTVALSTVKDGHNHNNHDDDVRLCFHIPPFNSVDHLHLHVLAPVSQMTFYYRKIKYNPKTRWCVSLEQVIHRLKRGQSPVPYRRPQ